MSQDEAFYASLKPARPVDLASFSYEQPCSGLKTGQVMKINGNAMFYQGVIDQSQQKLVVVKICAEINQASQTVKPIFQEVAALTQNSSFVAMDLFELYQSCNENYQLVMKVMHFAGFKRLSVPTFLLFKKGKLQEVIALNQHSAVKNVLISAIERYR